MSYSCDVNNVYCTAVGTAVGRKEKEGPLGRYFDIFYSNDKCGEKNYESGEIKLLSDAYASCLKRAKIKREAIDLFIAGDLNNQIACSSKMASSLDNSFIGVYGACATSMLGNAIGSLLLSANYVDNVMVGSTSSFATAERQFRYPQEYGLPKRESVTTTVTGSAVLLLSHKISKVKISKITLGEVCSPSSYDTTDMGTPMALAAYDTILKHLKNNNETFADYDLILTGDLSIVGSCMLKKLFLETGLKLNNHADCGELIYNIKKQKVFSGGSGAACCPLVTYTYIFDKIIRGVFKRVLVVATGALHAPIYVYQKKTIPTIAHAIVFERN